MVTHGIAAIHRDNVVTVRAEADVVDRLSIKWDVGRAMVKIRYSELPAGLHVAAAADRENTVVYLQPGLTPAQRRAALVRVRSSARMGQGPMLPRRAMARAIAADRVRMSAHIGTAAARRHPVLVLTPVIVLVISAIAVMFIAVKPLTVARQAKVAALVPTLIAGTHASSPPAHTRPGHVRPHRHAVTSQAPPTHVQQSSHLSACPSWPPWSNPAWWTEPSSGLYQPISVATQCTARGRHGRWWRTHHG
jgi:hypothetical protein